MSRTIREAQLGSRDARGKLAIGVRHWRSIEPGLHLGYRRGPKGAVWYARRYVANAGKGDPYLVRKLAIADDRTDADGSKVLNYRGAIEAARKWWIAESRREEGLEEHRGPFTVEIACRNYLKNYSDRGRRFEGLVRRAIEVHIIPSLGAVPVEKLTTGRIEDWLHGIANAPKIVRSAKGAKERSTRDIDRSDSDAVRKRQATANRILTTLKAALNFAWQRGKVPSDNAWRKLKPFRGVDAPRIRYLSADECLRLSNACKPDLRNIVRAALLTGARYSELCRLKVADVNFDAGVVTFRRSKNDNSRHAVLTDEGVALFFELTAGKGGSDHVFSHPDGAIWKSSQQTRPLAEACKTANIDPVIGFHILRHTHGSMLAMRGVPMGVIAAQLGHKDTRMTERHYAHLAPSYVAETIRASFPNLGLGSRSNVAAIRRGGTSHLLS